MMRSTTPIDERDARLAYMTVLLGDTDQALAADRIIESARTLNTAAIDAARATRRLAINRIQAEVDPGGAIPPGRKPARGELWAEILLLDALWTIHEVSLRVRSGEEKPL